MPTLLTHPAVPLSLGLGLGRRHVPGALLAAGVAASILPDIDVLAFRLGIPYTHLLGHRGITHSLLAAALVGLLAALRRWGNVAPWRVAIFITACMASHGLLDMLTTGGEGVAFLWPFSSQRIFSPFRVIRVSPLSLEGFFSPRGWAVLRSELLWVWLPCLSAGLWIRYRRR